MAAEYEVNIKINTQKVETDLNTIDNKIKNLGKSAISKEKSLERIVDKRARLMNRINEMEAKGLKVDKLRKQMGKATEQQSRRDLANAQKEYRVLERSLRLEQSKLRILRAQRQGFPASPIRGIRSMMGSPAQIAASGRQAADPIKGRPDLVGSPAYYEAQQKAIDRLARQGGPSDPIKGHPNLIGSPKYFEEQRKAIDEAARQGGVRSPLKGSKDLPGSPAYFDHLNREISRLARQGGARSPIRGNKDLIGSPAYYEHQRKELERLARQGGPSSPIRGSANMPGSPLALQGGMNRLGQVGLGAGFPLLFGGGPGSVIGGGLGGLTGSFGAQIALSAAGQQIDQLIQRTVESAESLGSVGTALDFLRERSLFSSEESEQLARKLENQGDLTGIAALVTEELNEALGPGGIQKMQDLAEQTRLAKEQWGQLTTNLELLIAGPLAEFLKIVNATLGVKVAQSDFARALTTLQGKDPQRLREMLPSFEGAKDPAKAIASNLAFGPNMAGGIFNMQGLSEGALISFTEQMNEIIRGMGTPDGTIPITEEDRKRFKPKTDTQLKTAQRLLEASQRRIKILQLETKEIEQITKFKDEIAAAELAGDKRGVARLRRDQALARLKSDEEQAIARINPKLSEQQQNLERINIEAKGVAQAAEIRAEFERDIANILNDEQNQALRDQAELLKKNAAQQKQALEENQRLAKGIADTIQTGFVDGIKAATDETSRLSDALANMLQRLGDQLLQIGANLAFYGNPQGNLKQGSGLVGSLLGSVASIFNPFQSLMDPGGRYEGQSGKLAPTPPPLPPLPGKELGGAVSARRPYIVGERGPELFVPGAQGNVVSSNAMGSTNVVVNVDASGSQAQGNEPNAKALGSAIGAAVQAELVKQKRPGGLLS